MAVFDLSCLPCCTPPICCGFTCENYPATIDVAITVISAANAFCANLFATATLTFSGNCATETWEWVGAVANGTSGVLRCNAGVWEFQVESDPLNWHPVSILSCSPFHAICSAHLTNFFGFGCEGDVDFEFTL